MTDPFNLPEVNLDAILDEILPSIKKDALDLKFGDVQTFMYLVDMACVDLAIFK